MRTSVALEAYVEEYLRQNIPHNDVWAQAKHLNKELKNSLQHVHAMAEAEAQKILDELIKLHPDMVGTEIYIDIRTNIDHCQKVTNYTNTMQEHNNLAKLIKYQILAEVSKYKNLREVTDAIDKILENL